MRKLLLILLGLIAAASLVEGAITKEQLLSMAKERVDVKVLTALVDRDCVDFEIDASNAAELSKALPSAVIEAAIRCRQKPANVPPAPRTPDAAAPPVPAAPTAPASPAAVVESPTATPPASATPPAAATSTGELQVRAQFIGESAALSCACLLDGEPLATLSKPAQGEFGEAVPRTKIGKQSGFLSVPAGHHRLSFRCDPHAQELALELDLPAGQRRTVEVKETTLRHWKLGKIDTK